MKADGGFGFIDIFLGGDTKDGQKLSNSAIRSLAPMIPAFLQPPHLTTLPVALSFEINNSLSRYLYLLNNLKPKMPSTVSIGSAAEFASILKSSSVVITDCKLCPRPAA
jgi:hypothetical protein